MLAETRDLLETSRSRLIHPLTANNIDSYDLSRYSIKLSVLHPCDEKNDGKTFVLGQPIQVSWTAPENHGARDWIGVYKVTANKHTHITNISSRGLWQWTTPELAEEGGQSGGPKRTEGELVFKGSQLPWQVGTYEFRYHHDGKHNVMARSVAFDIVPPSNRDQRTLLRIVQNALGNDPERMPVTPLDEYVGMGETEARHVAYAIQLMYGVEFAWEIVLADKCVARLSKRIGHALEALAPFASASGKSSRRSSTSGNKSPSRSSSPIPTTCTPPMMPKVASETL